MERSWIKRMLEKGMTVEEIHNMKMDAQNATIVIPVLFLLTYSAVAIVTGWSMFKTLIMVSPFFAVFELVSLITDKKIDDKELKELMENKYQPHMRKL